MKKAENLLPVLVPKKSLQYPPLHELSKSRTNPKNQMMILSKLLIEAISTDFRGNISIYVESLAKEKSYKSDIVAKDSAFIAVKFGNDFALSLLNNHWQIENFTNEFDLRLVYVAALYGRTNTLKYLVQLGCKLNVVNKIDNLNINHYALFGGNVDIINYLKLNTIKVDKSNILENAIYCYAPQAHIKVENFLQMAVMEGDVSLINTLLKQQLNISQQSNVFKDPWFLGAFVGSEEVTKYFVNMGVKIDVVDQKGMSLIHYAISGGKTEFIKFLVNHFKIDVTAREFNKHFNLAHWSVYKNNLEALKYLMSQGVDIAEVDMENNTPLDLACELGFVEIATFLVGHKPAMAIFNKESTYTFDENLNQLFSKMDVYNVNNSANKQGHNLLGNAEDYY